MSRDKATYGKISDKYDEWEDLEKSRPPRATVPKVYTPEPESGLDMGKYISTAMGLGIAFLLLVLAALSFWTAAEWAGYARNGAMVGYALIGIFLLISAVGGAWATVNHNFRVAGGS